MHILTGTHLPPGSDAGRILHTLRDAGQPIHIERIGLAARVPYRDAICAVNALVAAQRVRRDGDFLHYVEPMHSRTGTVTDAIVDALGRACHPLTFSALCAYLDYGADIVRLTLRTLVAEGEVAVHVEQTCDVRGSRRAAKHYSLTKGKR